MTNSHAEHHIPPIDQAIVSVIDWAGSVGVMTYVVRDMLSKRYPGSTTEFIRRQLIRLERQGRVIRRPCSFSSHLCWAPAVT